MSLWDVTSGRHKPLPADVESKEKHTYRIPKNAFCEQVKNVEYQIGVFTNFLLVFRLNNQTLCARGSP